MTVGMKRGLVHYRMSTSKVAKVVLYRQTYTCMHGQPDEHKSTCIRGQPDEHKSACMHGQLDKRKGNTKCPLTSPACMLSDTRDDPTPTHPRLLEHPWLLYTQTESIASNPCTSRKHRMQCEPSLRQSRSSPLH